MSGITIREIASQADLDLVFHIRTEVFVREQKCLPSEEFDELDAQARHFLLFEEKKAVATGRFRKTEKGIKIERIATLQVHRGNAYATQIIQYLMRVAEQAFPENDHFYLHAQVDVMPLYKSLGFVAYGSTFLEADIVHQAMELKRAKND
jgi:predicted GNAT family N-acyltransferase